MTENIVDAGRESGFQWPLTAYVRTHKNCAQTFGLADLSVEGAYLECDQPVEILR